MKTATYNRKTKFVTLWENGVDLVIERCSGLAAAKRFARNHNATFQEAA